MKFFVSYTIRDKEVTKELLQSISQKLKSFGDVFIDFIDNDSSNRQERVLSELASSDILILLETANIYKSDWVKLELEYAKKRQIPIRKVSINRFSMLTDIEIMGLI